MDNEAVHNIENSIKKGKFRNKSHFVEYAVKKLLEEEKEKLILEVENG